MSDDNPEHDLRSVFAKARPWLIGVGLAAALGGLYYFLGTRGPRQVGMSSVAVDAADDDALRKLSDEVAKAEAIWRAADERGQGNSPEARAALGLAVEKQRERVRQDARATPAASEHLRRLEQSVADVEVRENLSRIAALEKEAGEARRHGRSGEAVEKFRAALALLQGVNRSNAAAAFKDLPRESRLKLDLEILEAEPLSRQVMNARAKAEVAAREERWDDVREAFQELLAAQSRINREYPRTPFVDAAAEDRVEGQIQSLQAASLAATVRDKVSGGEENALAGRHAEAARLFALAFEAQEKINTLFPKSRQYSQSTLDDLEARRQTALSADGLSTVQTLDGEIAALLRSEDLAAAQNKIAEAAQLVAALWRDFPRSRKLDETLRERVSYRAAKSASLAAVHGAVLPKVRALPSGSAGVSSAARVLSSEVPQALYALVMDKNPSRTPGEARAVDSVNWLEAQDFCRRLGWLLGRTVRLPTEAQYRAALGVKAGGASAEGDGSNFVDLTGGVAEWLDSTLADSTAVIAGGSYLDSAEALAAVPLARVSKTERARHVGFRIVVD
jgi:hypothetical protein